MTAFDDFLNRIGIGVEKYKELSEEMQYAISYIFMSDNRKKLREKNKMDSNGYNKSLFDTKDGTCYITGRKCDTARHEIFNKHARQFSKEDGLWVAVSPEMHERIHANENGVWDDLKCEAEHLWLVADWGRNINDFVNRFGRNYL